jgi:hypothetical protein
MIFGDLAKKCIKIIENNDPDVAIEKISKIKRPDNNKKVGYDNALAIYKLYKDKSVEYDEEIYKFNISSYQNKIKKNINKAQKYAKSKSDK